MPNRVERMKVLISILDSNGGTATTDQIYPTFALMGVTYRTFQDYLKSLKSAGLITFRDTSLYKKNFRIRRL